MPRSASRSVTSMRGWRASLRAAARRSASGARPRVSLSGLPGVTSHHTRSSPIRRIANRQAARCAAWGGSNVPPNRPMRMPRACGGKIGQPRRSNRVATGRRESVSPLMISERDPSRQIAAGGAGGLTAALRPRLSVAAYAVFETGELFHADRSAGVEPPGGNANFGTEPEFAAVGKLGRGIVEHDGRVDLAQELFRRFAVFGHDRVGVMGAIALDMRDGGVDAIDDANGQNGVQIFGAPVLLTGRLDPPVDCQHGGVAANLAAGVE